LLLLALLALVAPFAAAQQLVVTPAKPTGVYAPGEEIAWRVEYRAPATQAAAAPVVTKASYTIKRGGLTPVGKGDLDFSAGPATITAKLDAPDTLLLEITATSADPKKPLKAAGGAVVAPDKIQPSLPTPDDFDAFWKSKLEELAAVPVNAKVEPADAGKPTVEYFKVTMDNLRGTHLYGQLAKPKMAGKFPALLIVQYAGVYGLPKSNVVSRADQGWLALNVMAHDLPFDQPADFYTKASASTHKDYLGIGLDDREKNYFLRMYLGCYRAADYLANHPDWDGKTLVVMGTSQGGQQSLVTAGIHPKITAMLANVPAGCDVTAPQAGRAAGYPYFLNNGRQRNKEKEAAQTGRYFDTANFATRIKCPALISMGLIDVSCPPAGVLAAANQFKGPKEVLILPLSDHHGNNNAQAPYWSRSETWLRTLAQGQEAPVK